MQRHYTLAALITLCAGLTASATEFHFTQITDTPFGYGMFEPSINADGTLIAFSAAYDFTGENPEQNFEIYLYDAVAETYTQLTDSPSGYGHFTPLITPDGEYVVFRTPYDYTGGNPDASFELYQVRVADLTITQITDNPQYTGLFTPKMSGDGEYVVYRSNGDPVGSNGDASFEVFRLARTTGVIDQITVTPPPNLNDFPAPGGDGSRIVFRSRYDFDGSNPNGNIEIWMWDELTGVTAVTQTNIPQENTSPAVDGAGRFVAFISRYDFTGQNPSGTLEIFVKDTLNGTFAQVTTSGPLLHLEPVVSPDGTFLIFESQRDPLGQNPDTNREIFHYDIAGGVLAQLTDTTGGASIPGLSDRAQVNYAAIARDAPVFAIRNEHSLEPGFPNVGDNLELFLAEQRLPGDLNCDGVLNAFDIDPFVLALTDPAGYAAAWPDCDRMLADCNGDGVVNAFDIDPFVELLTGP